MKRPFMLYEPGSYPNWVEPGDFLLVHSEKPLSRFIQFCTGSFWNHSAKVVGWDGEIVEALQEGVVHRNVSEWKDNMYAVVSPSYETAADRRQAVKQALWMAQDGWSYDYATFFGMGLFWLTGGRVMLSAGKKAAICSAVVADALHAGGIRFPEKIPHFHTPDDLAERFGVPRKEKEIMDHIGQVGS